MSILFRPVETGDIPALVPSLVQADISVMGLKDPSLWKDFVKDAVAGGHPSVYVALDGSELIGWSIALTDSRPYWTRFFLRRPLLGAGLALAALRAAWGGGRGVEPSSAESPAGAPEGAPAEPEWPRTADRPWGTSRRDIVRHLNMTILGEKKRSGVGTGLLMAHLVDLGRKGATRVDAYVRATNTPSVRFTKKFGWSLVAVRGDLCLITMDLPPRTTG
ncbi:MAG: GNAT family N-acetyltransferase [Candidatus Eisenbacteria bacterium]